jgi:hypothetical protein
MKLREAVSCAAETVTINRIKMAKDSGFHAQTGS